MLLRLLNAMSTFLQIKHQIESSIKNFQNTNPAVRGFNNQRPNFEETEDEEEEEETGNGKGAGSNGGSSFGGDSNFGPPPTIDFADTERFKRGSQTQERFHKNDKNSGGHDTQKTFRKPMQKIQYNRPGKTVKLLLMTLVNIFTQQL